MGSCEIIKASKEHPIGCFFVVKMMFELQNSLAAGRAHPVLITTVSLNVYSFKKSLYFVKIG